MNRPVVLVSVGTDHHQFDRLIRWIDRWLSDGEGERVECVVQHGASAAPEKARGHPYLDHAALQEWLRRAAAVVSHGGPTTITESRRHGRLPVVVPRSPALGEHVDDHQERFCARMADKGLVLLARTEDELRAALTRAVAEPAAFAVSSEGEDPVAVAVRRFDRLVAELFQERGEGGHRR